MTNIPLNYLPGVCKVDSAPPALEISVFKLFIKLVIESPEVPVPAIAVI
jgi:hypothetical protein